MGRTSRLKSTFPEVWEGPSARQGTTNANRASGTRYRGLNIGGRLLAAESHAASGGRRESSGYRRPAATTKGFREKQEPEASATGSVLPSPPVLRGRGVGGEGVFC